MLKNIAMIACVCVVASAAAQTSQKYVTGGGGDCVVKAGNRPHDLSPEKYLYLSFTNVCQQTFHLNIHPGNGKAGGGGYIRPGDTREFICSREDCASYKYSWK